MRHAESGLCVGGTLVWTGTCPDLIRVPHLGSVSRDACEFPRGSLVRKPIAEPLPLQRILIAYPDRTLLTAAEHAFIAEAKQWLTRSGPNAPSRSEP